MGRTLLVESSAERRVPGDGAPGNGAAYWAGRNRRRALLVSKHFGEGLAPAEQAELQELEAEIDAYLDEVAPLPHGMLQELEACARRLGLGPSEHNGSDGETA